MAVYSEETYPIPVGLGIDSYNHPANIKDGFCPVAKNFIAKTDRLVTRKGLIPPLSLDTRSTYSGDGHNTWYSRLPNSGNEDWPVAMWGIGNDTWLIRQFNRDAPGSTSGDNMIVKWTAITNFRGAATYLDRIYILDDSGLKYHTVWNWSAGTTTETLVTADLAGKRGLFVFKDRMWSWDDTKIYYTDAPASPGAYAETWDTSANFIHIGAGTGLGKIWAVIPIGTKLFVFTGSGFYNISVLGSPENWVVRLIDATVQVNHQNCVYENKGLIYFVDTRGVWVTNQDEVILISETIQDIFDVGAAEETYYEWKLFPFDDGILISKTKTVADGVPPSATQKTTSEARLFYTKLDFLGWTEFTFSTTTQPGDVLAAFSNMETQGIWNKSNYIVLVHGTSTDGAFADLTAECLYASSYQDILRKVGAAAQTVAVAAILQTKTVRGQMLTVKKCINAYINFSTPSNSEAQAKDLAYSWDTEQEDTRTSGTSTSNIVDYHEGLVRIKGPEFFRHVRLNLTATLSNAVREYTILGAAMDVQVHRKTPLNAS